MSYGIGSNGLARLTLLLALTFTLSRLTVSQSIFPYAHCLLEISLSSSRYCNTFYFTVNLRSLPTVGKSKLVDGWIYPHSSSPLPIKGTIKTSCPIGQ